MKIRITEVWISDFLIIIIEQSGNLSEKMTWKIKKGNSI